ncbi:MAG: transketolase [Candidatus Omnitrophica bacterium]|nr:transketolase [Candidatus Omnitrophota bacterium]
MSKTTDIEFLKSQAKLYRREILELTNAAKCGHPGGSLSAVEILLTLYSCQMNHDPANPLWEDRDRLIVSKGHISPAVYVTLANQKYFSKDEYKLYRKFGGLLQGHVYRKVPGVEFSTGSLGHGLSVANGLAIAAKMQNKRYKTYCLLGDGEIQEGSVWEAAMTASHRELDNVCAIIDYNKVQENGPTNEIKNLEPLADKWRSFGWHTVEAIGHNFPSLLEAFQKLGKTKNKPLAIIAHTIKGKGVSFMEGEAKWHGKAPNEEQLKTALAELN